MTVVKERIRSLWERVPLAQARAADDSIGGTQLVRALGAGSLILIGVGNAIGAGIFVLTGTAAAQYAGPAIAISYLIAGFVCLLTSLCYAEASALIPSAGGSYAYARVTLGRFPAWLIGWCMIFEYLIAGSTVAVGWSGYAQNLLAQIGLHLPQALAQAPFYVAADHSLRASGALFDLPAVIMIGFCTLVLVRGVRGSALINAVMVNIKLAVIVIVIVVGAFYVNGENWTPFVPPAEASGRFGWPGVLTASAIAFFSYTGFEAMSTSAREAHNPARTLPFALVMALLICMVLYISMALIMTGLAPYPLLDTASPITAALTASKANLGWLITLVNIGTVIGLGAAVLISLYGQSRVFYAMARDGEMPRAFGRISDRYATPRVGSITIGAVAGAIAALFPISLLGELVSMGCLIAFASVCLSVLILRHSDPAAPRAFKVPFYPVVPVVGFVSCIGLMFSLPAGTWYYIGMWILAGAVLFLLGKAIGSRRRAAD